MTGVPGLLPKVIGSYTLAGRTEESTDSWVSFHELANTDSSGNSRNLH